MPKDLAFSGGPVSLSLQVGERHLSLVLALCCCVIIIFSSALSLNKMMLLQSHSMCVQGAQIFSLFRKSIFGREMDFFGIILWKAISHAEQPTAPMPKAA